MAVRRDVAVALGGFDEKFGPGARFPSADEWDLCIRALLRGHRVVETPTLSVVHDGFRTTAEGRAHTTRDWKALGAVCTKAFRAGHPLAAMGPALFVGRKALLPPLQALVQRRRPQGLARVLAFVSGFREGMSTPMDPDTLHFR